MKTILVPTESHPGIHCALETALLLAQRYDSYIEGFALRWAASEFVAADMVGGIPLEAYRQDAAEAAKEAQHIFASFMSERHVPYSNGAAGSLSFGWSDGVPEGANTVGSYGRVFDVIVMNRLDTNSSALHKGAIESGLFESGRPILLAPPSPPSRIATNVLIAWNGSTEQVRAIAFAMPLLQRADHITVLTIIGGTGVPGPTAEQLVRYLHRNGIAAESLAVEIVGKTTGEAILAITDKLGCDLLIKGAYTQSRLRQMIFGGATRHILANAVLPVLMAH